MKCPLNHQDLDAPLENITAQTLRECVKTFEGLDYSPEEANVATDLADALAKHARLGFTEVQFSCISEKMTRYLESKGIHVLPLWQPQIISKVQEMYRDCGVYWSSSLSSTKHHHCCHEDKLTEFLNGEIPDPVVLSIQTGTLIGWGEVPPTMDDGNVFSDRNKAVESAERDFEWTKDRDMDFLEKMREAVKPDEPRKIEYAPRREPANTGCLPLLIACPAAIWGILNLF